MPKRTQFLSVLPWVGGLNTSQDPSIIAPNELTVADNVIFGQSDVKLKREGIDFNFDDGTDGTDSFIGLHDFHFESGTTKVQRLISVDDTGKVFSYTTSGTRTERTGQPEIYTIDFTGSTAANLDGDFIILQDDAGSFAPWWDIDDSGTTIPAGASAEDRALEITTVNTGDSATVQAASVATALDADSKFSASAAAGILTITTSTNGVKTNPDVSGAPELTAAVTQQGRAPWVTPTKVSMLTYNNLALMAADGVANLIQFWDGTTSTVVQLRDHPLFTSGDPDPPLGSILQQHLGRVWTNDENNPDRLHFSETFNAFKWIGFGDSGAIDIGIGDGDPVGITAIFPSFKGELFVAKKTKLYRISGFAPETFQVRLVSSSIGCESQNSVVGVDQDDIFWISARGIHSLAATANFGDFEAAFVSKKIQKTFNDDINFSRLKFSFGAYLDSINSVAFALASSGSAVNDEIFLYNVPLKAWYKWPSISCESLITANDGDRKRLYMGSNTRRIAQTFTGADSDTSSTGSLTAVVMRIVTGVIHPDNIPYTIKAWKKFSLVYKPVTTTTFTISLKIDNLPAQALSFNQLQSGALLGSTFTLGSSLLGIDQVMAPFAKSIDGYGRGIQIDILQSNTGQSGEIQGFMIEFEKAGDRQEVQTSATNIAD